MPVIATLIEPHGVTRVFFDCRNAKPDPDDQRRVEEAIESSIVLAQAEESTQGDTALEYRDIPDFVMFWHPVIARGA
jgi:hypothetical protein